MWVVMDLKKCVLTILAVMVMAEVGHVSGNVLSFPVQHKFAGTKANLRDMMKHDVSRKGRLLSVVDLELGGDSDPTGAGLYFTKITIGTPPKDYYVQIDTGSDILWVNCIECGKCPKKSDLGIDLKLYDPKGSSSSSFIYCDQDTCSAAFTGPNVPDCKPNMQCQYQLIYGDGSQTNGYFVKDTIQFNSGNAQMTVTNGSVIFGCGANQTGELGTSDQALDGIIGFGQSNASMISQLAAAGKVKKTFAHCLNSKKGGGIFTIGEIVSPKVNMTPMVPDMPHYNVNLEEISVGGKALEIPSGLFESKNTTAIVDSGTTMAYIPGKIYQPMIEKIMSQQPGLNTYKHEGQYTCIDFKDNLDDGFPVVELKFENNLSLSVYPHDYFFKITDNSYCFGWIDGGLKLKNEEPMILLGDMVLSNKLVVYDVANQTIGWTEYDCSSNIKTKDDDGTQKQVNSHDISSASHLKVGVLTFVWMLIGFVHI